MALYHHVLYELWGNRGEGVKIPVFLTKIRGILFLKSIDIFFFFAIIGLIGVGSLPALPGGV